MSTEIEIVGYLRASPEGKPEWSEDCVCVDAVYPNYDGDESVSMPICRLADAQAIIAQRDARVAGAERCAECGTITARLDGDGYAKWCCHCGAKLNGDYVNAAALEDQQPSAGVVDEQAAFEAFDYSDRCSRLRREGGHYVYATTERELVAFRAGAAWQASLNPCRAQAVPEGYVLVPDDQIIEADDYGVHGSTFYYCKLCQAESGAGMLNHGIPHKPGCAMLAAAPSAKKESGYYSDQDWINAGCPRNEESE